MLNLQQKQSLQQKLSPQQIQYIKLLQLPTLALEQRIKAEMEINPLLEEGEDMDEIAETDTTDELSDSDEAETAVDLQEERKEAEEKKDEQDYDWDEYLNSSDDLYGYKARVDHSAEEDDREMPMPARTSMSEHLREQLSFLDLDDHEELVADQIIGSIDEDGYLRRSLDSIIDDIMFNQGTLLSDEVVEDVLHRIQRLDPPGIAARDLQECLMVQLEVLPDDLDGRDVAMRMLQKAYKAFTMKHFDQIMKKLDVEPYELKAAFDLIQRLNPKPGEGEFSASQNYITPDFTARFIDDEFIIMLNGRNAPQLHISRQYRTMLEQLSAEQRGSKSAANHIQGETRNFLKSKMESARWFINSINQRRQTMLKVMHAIVEIQNEFFRFGEGYLKPMILKDVAERIHMDISTISRVVNGKYVQTEFGVYELKYFFSEGLSTDGGDEISNKEVKAIIQSIIDKEDKKKPLSDQRIATMLEGKGFKIARRTVTKYREQLGIPVARLRKEIILA